MKTMQLHNKQQGAALIIGLVLLVVITVLAISGMNTATTELAMARNDQNYEFAFQAAETGLENIIAAGSFDTANTVSTTTTINYHDSVTAQVDYEDWSIVPDKADHESVQRLALTASCTIDADTALEQGFIHEIRMPQVDATAPYISLTFNR